MIITLSAIFLLIVGVYIFMRSPRFGRPPSGSRLQRIEQSPNYKDGQFQNLSHTPALTEGATYTGVMKEFFLDKKGKKKPDSVLPSHKADLHTIPAGKDILVWFGHSSYFMQLDGKKILVDPVLSGHASPVKFTTRSFPGSDVYNVDDIPGIDYLIISHDHWDHLDYETVVKLKPRVKKVITSLGVGAHLERWGFDSNRVIENDWSEEVILDDGFKVNTEPARHFSGRGFKRNGTLWSSFILTTPHHKLYLGGDSGYDSHFAEIGKQYGPFDLAILENGQYDKSWKYIHMMPEEVIQAGIDLGAKRVFPVHWSKFSLGNHDWDDSIKRVYAESQRKHVALLHPQIGEVTDLNNVPEQKTWWENVQ